ncbi:MAG TPA: OmpA family protein [Streptosporangiaceae bacterium]|nr:OmpA family protein [Streptosporangiaceae bacterium]
MLRRRLAFVLGCALTLGSGACQTVGPPDGPPPSPGKAAGGPSAPVPTGGAIVKEGYFDADSRAARMRLEITDVRRTGEYAVLRFSVTNLDPEPAFGSSIFGASRVDSSFSGFRLLDTTGRRLYFTLRRDSVIGSAFGSSTFGIRLQPRVRYVAQAYFPALPDGVRQVTVLTPGTTAEIPGVPVVAGAPPAAPTEQSRSTPAPGQSVTLKTSVPSGTIWRKVEDLYDIVEGKDANTTSGGGGETIAFPADILFAFDSAALTGKARQVIADAATNLKNRADPARPIGVEGHTDGKGLPSHNRPLSERRAAAVRDALRQALTGQSYDFRVTGKADTEPVAPETTATGADNPRGRARNRRVEISYTLRPPTDIGSPAPGPAASGAVRRGEPGPPAPVRDGDGAVVAERTVTVDTANASGGERFLLRVRPFYRDGAYLTTVFELTNVGGHDLRRPSGFRGYFSADDFLGGDFGSFRVLAADGTVYRTVRQGAPPPDAVASAGSARFLSGSIILKQPDVPGRTYMYVPAPPRGVTSVTFDAGPFGKIPDVPIK